MQERLALAVERYDAGDTTSELNVIDSWVQYVRELFDLMPAEGEEAAATVARRMAAVPEAYRQFSQTLLDAARNGRPPARLQVEEVARQCAAWATPEDSFYGGLVERLTGVPDSLRGELDAAARAATAATAGLGAFLRRELLPLAREKDACGPEVYARASRYFLGAAVDLPEAYAWSWEEIARLRAEQARVSSLIRPGATREEAVAILDEDPARRIEGRENFRAWMQELAERTISELHGKHFDIPEPAQPDRGHDRSRQRRRDLLHRALRGLVPARADVVVGAGTVLTPSPPGRRSRPSTTRAFPATTCRSRSPWPSRRT